jgi:HEAT repeat protein
MLLALCLCWTGGGCETAPRQGERLTLTGHRRLALECLTRGVQYKANPVIRAAAVEALETANAKEALPWIRSALLDENAGVRFAACLAAGRAKDELALEALRERVKDEDPSVQVAAISALHRLGHTEYTSRMPEYLLNHQDPAVRANASIALVRMGEPGAVKILALAMMDPERGVQDQAAEALAILGNAEAQQQLVLMANSGFGSEEVFAINALAQTREQKYAPLYRAKLFNPDIPHLEVRLAAAKALALLGDDGGYELALMSLDFDDPKVRDPEDSGAAQVLRVRQLAAAALGAVGNPGALPRLARIIKANEDARVQVAAARAILEIVAANEGGEELFPSEKIPSKR